MGDLATCACPAAMDASYAFERFARRFVQIADDATDSFAIAPEATNHSHSSTTYRQSLHVPSLGSGRADKQRSVQLEACEGHLRGGRAGQRSNIFRRETPGLVWA
jgi:hypothetical protein